MMKTDKLFTINIGIMHIVLMTMLLALINLALRWPGEMPPDSIVMLNEAVSGQYSDWQPPITAILWSWMLHFADGGIPMLILQVALHWLGIGLFALLLVKNGHRLAALIMLASGLTPIALMYTGVVMKDSLLASLFIAAFGLASFNHKGLKAFGLLFGAVGMLTRANAVFAFPSLLFLLFRYKLSLFRSLTAIAILSLLLIFVSQWINHDILNAKRTNVERSLQLYDLAGISYFSGDASVLPVEISNLEGCYTPLYWDTLIKPRCDKAFSRIHDSITREWLTNIITHPVSYLQHRLYHFNYEIFFLVPPIQQCVEAPEAHDCPRSLMSDFISKNGALWPVVWLVLGVIMLFSGLSEIPKALVLSALAYGFAYLFVGVAANFRYFYWTELAIQTALIFQIATVGFPKWKIAAIAVSIVLILGYVWRLAYIM
jgi:hypothetical protein